MLAPALPVVALLAAAPLALSQTAPALTHSAPWLGKTLTLELAGLEPGAPYSLWLAANEASVPTPFGVLELDLASAKPLAQGLATPAGTASRRFPVPADASFAEGEVHLQAATLAPSTGALVLSNGAHLRLLGSRVYATQTQILEYLGPQTQRLGVYGATDLQLVYGVELPSSSSYSKLEPHVSPDGASTALAAEGGPTSQHGVLRFDHFFGDEVDFHPLVAPDGFLSAPSGDGWLVYGSPTPYPSYTFQVFHAPYDPTAPVTPLGIAGEPGTMISAAGGGVWIPATDDAQGEPRVNRVDVATGATLQTVVVGGRDENVQWITAVGDRLLVGTQTDGADPFAWSAFLNWVDTQSAPTVLNRAALGSDSSELVAELEASGDLLVRRTNYVSASPSQVLLVRVDPAAPAAFLAGSDSVGSGMDFADLGDSLWLRENCCGTTDFPLPSKVWNVDPTTADLVAPATPGLPGPLVFGPYNHFLSLAATDDFTGTQLVLGNNRLASWPWVDFEEVFLRIDPVTGVPTGVPVGLWSTLHLHAISIP